jgi:hypothetical protein
MRLSQVSLCAERVLDSLFFLTADEKAAAAAVPEALPQLAAAVVGNHAPWVRVGAGELLWMLIKNAPTSAAAAAIPSVIASIADSLMEPSPGVSTSNNDILQAKGIQLVWAIAPHMHDRSSPDDLVVVRAITSGLVDMLNHTEQAYQEQGAMELAELGRCAGCLEPEAVPGVFAALVGWLRSHDPNLQQLGLTVIKSLTFASSEYRAAVAAVPGTLDLLMGYVLAEGFSRNSEMQVQAAELLAALRKGQADSAIRAQVTAIEGCYEKLVKMLEDKNTYIQILGADMIGSLARHDVDVRTAIIATDGCVPGLMKMLNSKHEGAQQRAASCLSRLTLTQANQMRLASEPGYISRLVHLLKTGSNETQAQAGLALHDLAAGSKPNRVFMRNMKDCLNVLSDLSRGSGSRRMQIVAIVILRWFITNRQARQLLEAGKLEFQALMASLPPPAPTKPQPQEQQQQQQQQEFDDPLPKGCMPTAGEDTPWWISAYLSLRASIKRRNQINEPHRSRGFEHRISDDIQAALPGC